MITIKAKEIISTCRRYIEILYRISGVFWSAG